jgi:hypothetical protein
VPRKLIFLTFAALLACAALFAACGGDDDATSTPTVAPTASPTPTPDAVSAAAEQFMRDLATGYNSGDIQGFIDKFSDKGIVEFADEGPDTPADQARADTLQFAAGGTVTIHTISDVSTTGDVTTLTVDSDDGSILQRQVFQLKKSGTTFLIDGSAIGSPDVPAGVAAVTVEATEHKYILDATQIAAGQQAFAFSNIGSQFHELRLLKVDATTPTQQIVDDALAVEDPSQLPADIEADVGAGFAGPGQTSNVVFVDPLAAGRYIMICFIPDATDEQPHAAHGMFKEFTIP